MKTLRQAEKRAKERARRLGETFYVIMEDNQYYVANDEDLDTYFCAVRDQDILYCTDE